jgi:hypothetical protein
MRIYSNLLNFEILLDRFKDVTEFCDPSLLAGLHDLAKVRGSNLNLSQVEAGLDTLLMATSHSPPGGLEIESAAAICERLSRDSVANSRQIYSASSAQYARRTVRQR